MDKQPNATTRRDVLIKLAQSSGFVGLGGLFWGGLVQSAKNTDYVLRPPGALPEKDFLKACIKCGACVEACPYDTLKLAAPESGASNGSPFFEPRQKPCYMCTDIPCVPVCPSGALDKMSVSDVSEATGEATFNINKARMGLAVIDTSACIAFAGIQCDACYRACPLMGEAIKLEYERNEDTGKHALVTPVVMRDVCTGCGACEQACVTELSSILVVARDKVTGRQGDFYRSRGGKQTPDSLLQQTPDGNNTTPVTNQSTLDYLNSWEDLIDDTTKTK